MHKDLGRNLALKLLSAWAKLGNLKQKGTNGMAQLMIVTTFLSDLTKDEVEDLTNGTKHQLEEYEKGGKFGTS